MGEKRRAGAIALAAILFASRAPAQQRESAEELFQLGKTAIAKKDYPHACEYFRASLQTEFALGTLLNLATCHEQEGKLASAWSEFRALEDHAARATPPQTDRAEFAHERAEALRPRVSRLRIALSPAARRIGGLAVKVDAVPVDPHLFEAGVPVDPGERKVLVEAPDREPWSTTLRVAGERLVLDVEVPDLRAAPRPVKPARIDVDDAERIAAARSRRTAGYVIGAVGGAFVVTGALFGLLAKHAESDSRCAAPCYVNGRGYSDAQDAYSRAKAFAWTSDIGLGLGLVGLGVGTYLVLTAPKKPATAAVRFGPSGIFVEGSL